MEWFVLLIPFVFSIVGLRFFGHEIHKLELIAPIVISIIFILIFKVSSVSYSTSDTEFWGGKIVQAQHYEPWDEWIEETCSYDCCCDTEGNNCSTIYYDCSYVRYHSEAWYLVDENGFKRGISQREYRRLVSSFTNEAFKDMNRDYHHNDGDMYFTNWNNQYTTIENVVTKHSYVNRPQATKNLFYYEDLDENEVKGLYEYPPIIDYKQQHLLGINNPSVDRELDRINGLLAKTKQLKLFVLVYDSPSDDVSYKQEAYWKGGNKNEFILTLGVQNNKILWSRVISWTENQYSKINAEKLFMANTDASKLKETVHKLIPILKNDFERKQFKDFDYIKVPLNNTQTLWLYISAVVINFLVMLGVVKNGIK